MNTLSGMNISTKPRMAEHVTFATQESSTSLTEPEVPVTVQLPVNTKPSPGRKPRVQKVEPPALNLVDTEAPVTDEFSHFMNIGCTENKLSVKFETAGAVPLAPNKAGGKALVKINDGKAISYPYNRVQDFDGGYWVELKNPKLLTTNLLKGAKKLAVKIPTSNRSIVRLFAVKDLVDFQAKFKSRGCPLR